MGSRRLDRTKRRCSSPGGRSQHVGGAPPHGRIERAQPVGAHDDGGRKALALAMPVDAADERVHAGAVFVVHLRRLARLRERVGFVDQQDDAAARLAAMPTSAWPRTV